MQRVPHEEHLDHVGGLADHDEREHAEQQRPDQRVGPERAQAGERMVRGRLGGRVAGSGRRRVRMASPAIARPRNVTASRIIGTDAPNVATSRPPAAGVADLSEEFTDLMKEYGKRHRDARKRPNGSRQVRVVVAVFPLVGEEA